MPGIVIAMLVVTCPCALGLATPLTMVASLGKAARAGILVRGGDVLERLARPGTLVLDKTGTVTEGAMRVMRIAGDRRSVQRAAAAESSSIHPVARAITELRSADPTARHTVTAVAERAGHGIAACVDGREMIVGNAPFMHSRGVTTDDAMSAEAAAMERDGLGPVFVAEDGAVRAVIGVGDPMRADAPALVRSLADRGWQVHLCSGDVPSLVGRAGEALGVDRDRCLGGQDPEAKMRTVEAFRSRPVVMIGDGVNDMPAMAAADVGIAVRQGARATLDRADVALTGGGLSQVVSLVDGAARTMRTVHVNFGISIAYNVVGAVLAATGLINPLIAAVMMPLSGLTVTAVALRMPRFRAPGGGSA
jgi:Cu2+-exporting ATPase